MAYFVKFSFERIAHTAGTIVREIGIFRDRIATLDHKIRNDTMECRAIILALFVEFSGLSNVVRSNTIEKLKLHRAELCLDHKQALRVGAILIDRRTGVRSSI